MYKSLHFLSPSHFSLSLRIRLSEEKGEEFKAQGGALFDIESCSGEVSK